MDTELSEEELKRIYQIRDQYIQGESPIILSSLFKGAFKTTPWKDNFDTNDTYEKDQLDESTIGTIDLEKTLPYDLYEEDKQPSTEENITDSTPPKCTKNE